MQIFDIREMLNAGQHFALQKFKRSASSSTHMAEFELA